MSTQTINTTTIWPTLSYANARGAIAFLVDAFGFIETAVYGEGERVDHAQLDWPGGGGVMLGSQRPDSAVGDLPTGVGSVYIVVPDPDALYRRAVDGGATIVKGLTDEDYGSRGFTCRDPEGVYWSFGTYAGEPPRTQ
ncbi:VOC family protein [Rhodococcus sp. PvR099]|uniref:VOC family protein n=1 Tax=Rhodococcus sp. PvR099 TaxID=2806602 RepID=UPI001AE70BD0|nr:VOC family protein [Rhodococcus sp. PvR099]MBP1159966.1 putative glyoxalase superfamily protein PhnB [Rhodococcus sp. PvR099]